MSEIIEKAGMSPERIERVRQFIQGYINAGKHFGAEIIVARNGRIALQEAFGFAGPERDRPLPAGSVYSIFSVSKTFTSVLTLMAIEKGLLSLTTKVSEIIPEFRAGRREIHRISVVDPSVRVAHDVYAGTRNVHRSTG